ncbi:5-hydroxytryptamine receptor 3A-like isoform X1 [Hyla sarda]|uniref:5-hydroxytryptamine receptor 3A-like isoform X1 n=1 Tax=Hyla sarda TaxID=327740 RepID=UPI0024C2C32F|nr:5-hydroxytryptamine receptor 3A-like isoform X1 [Hyla sarda]
MCISSCLSMSPHTMTLLLTCTLFGVGYGQLNCSFDILINNLSFPSLSIRPVKNWRTATEIQIEMALYNIIDLDTSLQSFTTLVWFTMIWNNEFIQWEPQQYCSIEKIFLSNVSYWQPDLYIYERIQSEDKSPSVPFYSIQYNGLTTRAMPLRIVSSCTVDVFKFPFDIQKCNITFGSYIHPVQQIFMYTSLNSAEVLSSTKSVIVTNDNWDLLSITVTNNTLDIKGEIYSTVSYEITIKREPAIYIITLIAPACFMVILDLASMFIQMDSGQGLGFKITIVLGFSVLLSILNTMLPTSDMVPVLGIFCCVVMAVMVFSIMESIAISYMLILSKSQSTVPSWIKTWILRYLARALFFKEKFFMEYGIKISQTETNVNPRVLEEQSMETKRKPQNDKEDKMVKKLLKMLLQEVKKIHDKIVDSNDMDDLKTEWHAVALVLERLVLLIYLLTVAILFAVVLIIWLT